MSATVELAATAAPRTRDAILAGIRAAVAEKLAPLAQQIDQQGLYPVDVLRGFAQQGLYSLHLKDHTPLPQSDLGLAIEAMGVVAETCMSTGFCNWCQDAAGWYLENCDNPGLKARLQGEVARGTALGGTGLSNPMKSFTGIEEFKLRGKRVDGGWMVSGVLPWVSNLGDGHWFGTVFTDGADARHRIMAMVRCGQPGVEIRRNTKFIALEGTGTYAVLFRNALIGDDQIMADPAEAMVKRIKPGFILLQTGMAIGVIQASIDTMREADASLGHTNAWLPRRADDYAEALAAAKAEIMTLAATPYETDPEFLRRVLQIRLAGGELVVEAAHAAMLHCGARGYIEGSAAHRRLREAYFVAVVTPSLKHLRQEIAAIGAH